MKRFIYTLILASSFAGMCQASDHKFKNLNIRQDVKTALTTLLNDRDTLLKKQSYKNAENTFFKKNKHTVLLQENNPGNNFFKTYFEKKARSSSPFNHFMGNLIIQINKNYKKNTNADLFHLANDNASSDEKKFIATLMKDSSIQQKTRDKLLYFYCIAKELIKDLTLDKQLFMIHVVFPKLTVELKKFFGKEGFLSNPELSEHMKKLVGSNKN